MENREEHLKWCKERALEYLDKGDLMNAFISMGSDLSKHAELAEIMKIMFPIGMLYVKENDARGMRRWITGFN